MRKRLGIITPSSNSVLEPVTSAMLHGVDRVSAHFSRFRVTEIALDAAALSPFDASAMIPAADLLADAKIDATAWNGTSANWLGISRDRSLCEAITARTGVPTTTSTDNFSFGVVEPATIAGMIRAVAAEGVDAAAILNSVAVTLWRTLGLPGGEIAAVAKWGRIFQPSRVIK